MLVLAAGVGGAAVVEGAPAWATPGTRSETSARAGAGVRPALPAPRPTTTWSDLEGPAERAAALGRQVTAPLVAAGMPAPTVEAADIGPALGQFDAKAWTLRLSLPALSALPARPTSAEARVLAAAAHHEARHAEQWFRMARLRAADGRTPADIAVEMSIPAAVAEAAGREHRPGTAKLADAEARQWWESVYGAGARHRNQVLADLLAAKSAYDEAARSYRGQPSPTTGAALLEAKGRLAPAYAAYQALPEEADALAVQAHHDR